mmetsp:Transcript_22092/g.32896  ORF Transcript_22092/g.32896 Transcript_22092/m.32896 type:complete len:83 (+) Transcript_22092:540-788(+)
MKAENEKVASENKILKRAVTIQQERQHHANSQIEAANRYKEGAEEKMRMMEQMILTLRYHLSQLSSNSPGNDFMTPRPPDVY